MSPAWIQSEQSSAETAVRRSLQHHVPHLGPWPLQLGDRCAAVLPGHAGPPTALSPLRPAGSHTHHQIFYD